MAVVQKVLSGKDARSLAEHLLGKQRALPAVVVTAGSGDLRGLISAGTVADDVGELAEVWWMPTGDVTWEFKAAMPDLTQVFGDAGRVYDLEGEWKTNAYASTLYMCGTAERARQIEEDLVADAMEAAAKAGLLAARTAKARMVTGVVRGFPAQGRAIVRGDFGFATIRSELVPGAIPVERVLRVGMSVTGRLDERDKLFDLTDAVRAPEMALSHYSVGDTVLVRVKTVGRAVVAVELYPGKVVEIRVSQVTGHSDDDLRDLMSIGEVVAARVERTGSWLLSMADVDDEVDPVACSLLEGGPPWLETLVVETEDAMEDVPDLGVDPNAPTAPEVEPLETPTREPAPIVAVAPGPNAHQIARLNESYQRERRTAESLRAEIAQLSRNMESLETEVVRSRRTIEHLKTRQRELLKKARKGRPVDAESATDLFIDSEQQLRHEVYLEWVERIPASDKDARPLPNGWSIGPGFLESLAERPADLRPKVVAVMVEVLLDLVASSPGREVHRLRTGMGGDAPYVQRTPGEFCFRCAVQQKTPGAPRLHYWKAGNAIEFSRVVPHDDMDP